MRITGRRPLFIVSCVLLAMLGYRAGEGTNTDVIDARTAFSRAEANHTQALFDYNIGFAALHRAVGTVMAGWLDRKEIKKRSLPNET